MYYCKQYVRRAKGFKQFLQSVHFRHAEQHTAFTSYKHYFLIQKQILILIYKENISSKINQRLYHFNRVTQQSCTRYFPNIHVKSLVLFGLNNWKNLNQIFILIRLVQCPGNMTNCLWNERSSEHTSEISTSLWITLWLRHCYKNKIVLQSNWNKYLCFIM